MRIEKVLDSGEGHIFLDMLAHHSLVGTWSLSGMGVVGNFVYLNTSGSLNDKILFKSYLNTGTYNLKLLSYTNTDCGISTCRINGGVKGTMDLYSAGHVVNVIKTISDITVSDSGLKDIELIALSKHASASAYRIPIRYLILYRTA